MAIKLTVVNQYGKFESDWMEGLDRATVNELLTDGDLKYFEMKVGGVATIFRGSAINDAIVEVRDDSE